MNENFIVYKATNKVNGKKYIGLTKRTLEDRIYRHVRESEKKDLHTYNTPFKRAIRKYGIDNFEWEILEEGLTENEAYDLEKYYIEKYKTYYKFSNSNGYNATVGGDFISHPKDRMICVNAVTGEKCCVGFISNIQKFLNMKSQSPIYDSCNKSRVGLRNKRYFVYWEKDILNLSQTDLIHKVRLRANVVVQMDDNYNPINYFISEDDASKTLKISQGNIHSVICGKRLHANGFVFMRYKDFIANKRQRKPKTKCIKIKAVKNGKEYFFDSLTDMHIKTGTQLSSISCCLNGKRNHVDGYKIYKV